MRRRSSGAGRRSRPRRAEKAAAPEQLSLLDDVPSALPALSRAAKLRSAPPVGFDWPEALPVVDKVREELDECWSDERNDPQAIAEELGDLLFVVVSTARHLKVDPENALRAANGKFEQRFASSNRPCGTRDDPSKLRPRRAGRPLGRSQEGRAAAVLRLKTARRGGCRLAHPPQCRSAPRGFAATAPI